MTMDVRQLREIVVTAIARAAELPVEEVHDGVNLLELGLDSLSFAGILIDIEDGVGAEVPAEVLDRFIDAGDVVTPADVVGLLSTWEPVPSSTSGLGPYSEVGTVTER